MSNLKNILLSKKPCKSVWFMRQAGRYLPEFRKIRSQNTNFIELCLNSNLSSEITLQPIKRFDLDSAIIFSDILMVPYALGQKVDFIENHGPKLSNFNKNQLLDCNVEKFTQKLNPIYEAIRITRKKLHKNKSLISFIGAPWTLIIYMLELKNNRGEINHTKLNEKHIIKTILKELINYLCVHIKNQISAGADVIQIFDSWAGLAPIEDLEEYCFEPNAKLIEFCKREKIPNICFPKGIKEKYEDFNRFVKPDGINLDYQVNPIWAKEALKDVVLQGGLNPKVLLESEGEILKEATKYIKAFSNIPYVFNLGHGLLPQTDPAKLEKLIKFYRNFNG